MEEENDIMRFERDKLKEELLLMNEEREIIRAERDKSLDGNICNENGERHN